MDQINNNHIHFYSPEGAAKGPAGPRGKTGKTGPIGKTGKTGPPGTFLQNQIISTISSASINIAGWNIYNSTLTDLTIKNVTTSQAVSMNFISFLLNGGANNNSPERTNATGPTDSDINLSTLRVSTIAFYNDNGGIINNINYISFNSNTINIGNYTNTIPGTSRPTTTSNISIGNSAGYYNTGSMPGVHTVSIGNNAGLNSGSYSVAIGSYSLAPAANSIAIGKYATTSGSNTICIGNYAGGSYVNSNSIVLGSLNSSITTTISTITNTIVLNATGNALSNITNNAFYISPVSTTTTGLNGSSQYRLYWNSATGLIFGSNA